MALLGFLNSDVKITVQNDNFIKQFIIAYPRKNGSTFKIGMSVLKNILKDTPIIVNFSTGLCMSGGKELVDAVKGFLSNIQNSGVNFKYRTVPSNNSGGGLAQLLQFNKKKGDDQIITIDIPKDFDDDNVLNQMLELGCEVFVPIEYNEELLEGVFNYHFQDDETRFSTFKYVLFINDLLGQAALRTTVLGKKDVEKICHYE